jgi:hypothetical protein
MTPSEFRRDRWLRTSAYHLSTWSLTAFALALRAEFVPRALDATGAALAVALAAGSVLSSLTHERRVAKMAGVAGEAAYAGAGRLWSALFGVLAVVAALLVGMGAAASLYAAAMLVVGTGFALWGRRAKFDWYFRLGLAMVSAGAFDLAVEGSALAAPLRLLVLGLGLPAAALATNRRYLWFRPEA